MSAYRAIVVVIVVAGALMRPSPAAAQPSGATIPVAVGQKVKITVADGRTIKGTVSLVTPESIELAGTRITASDVQRVQLSDSVGDGAGKGALILGALGALFGIVGDSVSDGIGASFGGSSSSNGSGFLAGAAIGLAAGAAIGAALDATNQRTVYERRDTGMSVAVRPIVSNAGKGVGVSLRW